MNSRIDFGGYYKSYYIGISKRLDFYIKTNRDTAEFIYDLISGNNLTPDYVYDIDLYLKAYMLSSFIVGKKFINEKLSIFVGGELISVQEYQDGSVTGKVISLSNNDYYYNAKADYYFSKNYLYSGWNYEKPSNGYGKSFYLSLKYNINNISKILLNINDLFGRLFIKNSPHSIVYLNSSNKKYDSSGHIVYDPLISGKEEYVNYTLKMVTKYNIEYEYKKYFIGCDKYDKLVLPYIGLKYYKFKFTYGSRFKNFTVNFKNRYFSIGLNTNKLNLKKASSFGVFVGLNYNF
ncbi:hypothetical protein [Nautilia sp. PV-1]|uniref:hypothetical protein n=1 Tax=Nautilia sp. PV-1 TaxID=2579250 RepID=UPI00143B192C|nr:hypothetical protein [Nautilia sp. PV-1]